MTIQWQIALPVVLMAALLAYISAPTSRCHQICSTSPNVTSLFVFGDDTVDAGNTGYPLSKHYGPANCPVKLWRMSDGRSLADLVADHFHLPYMPPHFDHGHPAKYTKYGVNFASSGCGIHNMTKPHLHCECKSLSTQVEAFHEYVKSYSKVDLDKSMALVSIGQNDFFYPHNGDARLPFDDLIVDLKRYLKKLVIGGVKNILITNLPPLGCYPTVKFQSSSHECDDFTNSLVENYNVKLIDMVDELKHPSRGFDYLSIRIVDVYTIVQEVIDRPRAVGVRNVDYPCCESVRGQCADSSAICEDKTEFAFFDNFHLTERMYELIFLHMKLFAPLR